MPGYKIGWRPGVKNFWPGRSGHAAIAICDHIMQASIGSADTWFKNSQSNASAHFGVAKDGRIWQWVNTADTAWANGPIDNPDTTIAWIVGARDKGINPNYLTISIEHEGKTGELFPEAQYQATLWLHQKLVTEFGIRLDGQHIIGHYQLDSVNRPFCPGTGFPWEQLYMDLQKTVGFDPSNGYVIGEGVKNILKTHNLMATTSEMYFKDSVGQTLSLTYASDGSRILAITSDGKEWDVHRVVNSD